MWYGFMNGAVNVFPNASIQMDCKLNVTSFKLTFETLFIKQLFTFPQDYVTVVDHTADMLRYPYGLTFSCFEATDDVFIFKTKITEENITETIPAKDPATGELIQKPKYSVKEQFDNRLMVSNNIVTNLLFNLGYMYTDIANYVKAEQSSLRYWTNVGNSIGDFMIRFWFREDFQASFQYNLLEDCDLTADFGTNNSLKCPEMKEEVIE